MTTTSLHKTKSARAVTTPKKKVHPAKKMTTHFAIATIFSLSIIVAVALVLDPLQFYRKSSLTLPIFDNEPRYQNPGLVRHYDYDTIILGSSMTENFRPSIINEKLGGEAMKLSIRGSVAWEQHDIATLALNTGKVKRIIWGIDYFALKDPDPDSPPYPSYLYNDTILDDYQYILNYDVYFNYAKELYKRYKYPNHIVTLDTLYNWEDAAIYGTDIALKAFEKSKSEEFAYSINEEPIERVEANFDRYFTSLVTDHPEVEFIFFYPPYSILRQILWADNNQTRFENQLDIKRIIFDKMSAYDNVTIYDFQVEKNWTYNLELYKDLSHYSEQVNTWMIEAIAAQDPEYIVTAQNIELLNETLLSQIDQTLIYNDGVKNVLFTVDDTMIKNSDLFVGEDNSLYIKVGALAKLLNLNLSFDGITKVTTLINNQLAIELQLNESEIIVNGSTELLDYPILNINGSTFIPIFEMLHYLNLSITEQTDQGYDLVYRITTVQ